MMSKGDGAADCGEQLSALADGECGSADVADICGRWRDDPALRARWHRYQMIGDVLRSEDLACAAAHDSDFLRGLRARLEAEPVVLAPAALAPAEVLQPALAAGGSIARPRRRVWPAAVAAGFVTVVAAGFVFNQQSGPAPATLAAAPGSPGPALVPSAMPVAAVARPVATGEEPRQVEVADGRLVRDARLDRYFAAHQQWSGGSIGGNVATLRHVAADAPKR